MSIVIKYNCMSSIYKITGFRLTEGNVVSFGIVGMIAVFAILLILVSAGGVRHVPITWKEKVEAAVAFRNFNGETKVVGIKGNSQINPTLLSRTGDTLYVLKVINQDNNLHMLYIDGLNLHTKILRPGENDTISIYSKKEGTYGYYDRIGPAISEGGRQQAIGQFKAVRVAADE